MGHVRRTPLGLGVACALALSLGALSVGAAANALAVGVAAAAPTREFVADPASTWQTDNTVYALATANGVVYAGGDFTAVRPPKSAPGQNTTPRARFAAFDATTGDLLPCAPSFTNAAGNATIRALEVSSDGSTLYVGGRFDAVNGAAALNFAAIALGTCTPRNGIPRANGIVHAIAASPGAVYLGGQFTKVKGLSRTRLAAVTPSGSLLPWAPTANNRVRALTVAPGETRVYAGGKFSQINGSWILGLVALDPSSGSVVQTFPGWIDTRNQEVKGLAHDDQNLYLGAEGTGGGVFDGRIAADVQTGQLRWRDNCLGATQAVLPYNDVLFSASHAHDCSRTPGGFPNNAMQGRQHFLAQSIADSTILPWFPDTDEGPHGSGVGPYALAVSDGVLWSGGMFTTVNGTPQQGLTRFPTGPDTGNPAVVATPNAVTEGQGIRVTWQASWDRDDGTLTYLVYRTGVAQPVGTVTADSRYWSRPTLSFTDGPLPTGTYTYRVAATDGVNTSRSPLVSVSHTAG